MGSRVISSIVLYSHKISLLPDVKLPPDQASGLRFAPQRIGMTRAHTVVLVLEANRSEGSSISRSVRDTPNGAKDSNALAPPQVSRGTCLILPLVGSH